MILKGSQRGGGRQLARHLLRRDENDHVEVVSLRGFVSSDLLGALSEAEAIARGTRCKQFLFSLSLNPPKDSGASTDDLLAAVERAEKVLGLTGQPRAIVLHEKCGRLHAHAVWSRIEPARLRAVPMSFFKTKLTTLSKDLFLQHGWELPNGHKENGWKSPDNFTLAEWQQAKRIDFDPRELKALFRDAWVRSDNLASFRDALAAKGYFLARGDRRGFVAVDVHGEVFSVARMLGIKTKEVVARLGTPDGLLSVAEIKAGLASRLADNFRKVMQEARRQDRLELAPLRTTHRITVKSQRRSRVGATMPSMQRNSTKVPVAPRYPSVAITPKRGLRRHTMFRRTAPPPTATEPESGQSIQRGAPSLFIRGQRPGETYDAYMAYRRACFRIIDQQLEERAATQRGIDERIAAQRARRAILIAHMVHLTGGSRPEPAGLHP